MVSSISGQKYLFSPIRCMHFTSTESASISCTIPEYNCPSYLITHHLFINSGSGLITALLKLCGFDSVPALDPSEQLSVIDGQLVEGSFKGND